MPNNNNIDTRRWMFEGRVYNFMPTGFSIYPSISRAGEVSNQPSIQAIQQTDVIGHRYNYPVQGCNYEFIGADLGDTITYYSMNRDDTINLVTASVSAFDMENHKVYLNNGCAIHPFFIKINHRNLSFRKFNLSDLTTTFLVTEHDINDVPVVRPRETVTVRNGYTALPTDSIIVPYDSPITFEQAGSLNIIHSAYAPANTGYVLSTSNSGTLQWSNQTYANTIFLTEDELALRYPKKLDNRSPFQIWEEENVCQ